MWAPNPWPDLTARSSRRRTCLVASDAASRFAEVDSPRVVSFGKDRVDEGFAFRKAVASCENDSLAFTIDGDAVMQLEPETDAVEAVWDGAIAGHGRAVTKPTLVPVEDDRAWTQFWLWDQMQRYAASCEVGEQLIAGVVMPFGKPAVKHCGEPFK